MRASVSVSVCEQNAAPATKSALRGSQSAALPQICTSSAVPVTKSALSGSQSAAPARNSAPQGPQITAPDLISEYLLLLRNSER